MSFQLECPTCGLRSVYEFRFGGELRQRPSSDAVDEDWVNYMYYRANLDGVQREWWYHRDGCGTWFTAERDTKSNVVMSTSR